MNPGTYTLLVTLPVAATVEFGAEGAYDVDAGWYAYTGSAFGPGGLERVQRHRDLASGDRDVRHWHVDYLLGHGETAVDGVFVTEGADVECETARALNDAAAPIRGLGASDCGCETHLAHADSRDLLAEAASDAHDRELP